MSQPAFVREGGFQPLEAPFRRGVVARSGAPGEAVISARLELPACVASTLVYWEAGCDQQRARRERHGLLRCERELRVSLSGLEPGRVYWYRCWAGGHWTKVGFFYSASR